MAEGTGNQYLIAIALKDFEKLQQLGSEIKRIQELSAKGASFKINIDASALNKLESSIAERIDAAAGKGLGGRLGNLGGGGGPDAGAVRGLAGLLEQLKLSVDNLNVGIREWKNARRKGGAPAGGGAPGLDTPLPTGAAAIDFDMTKLNQAFDQLAARIETKLQGVFSKIPEMMDFDKLIEASKSWRDATNAGLARPFSSGNVGLREALAIHKDRFASPAAKTLAESRIKKAYQEMESAMGSMASSASARARRQERADNYLRSLDASENNRRRTLLQRSGEIPAQQGKVDKYGNPVRTEKVTGYVDVGKPYGGVVAGRQAVGALKALPSLQAILKAVEEGGNPALLQDFLDNPVLKKIIGNVQGAKSAAAARARAKAAKNVLAEQAALYTAYKPESTGRAPSMSPLDTLALEGPTNDAGEVIPHVKLFKKLKQGWRFQEYTEAERGAMENALKQFEYIGKNAKTEDAANWASSKKNAILERWNMGGEYYHAGRGGNIPFQGFSKLQKVIGTLDIDKNKLTPEGVAALEGLLAHGGVGYSAAGIGTGMPASGGGGGVGGGLPPGLAGGAFGGGGDPEWLKRLAEAMSALKATDMGAIASEFRALADSLKQIQIAAGRVNPTLWKMASDREREGFSIKAAERRAEEREHKLIVDDAKKTHAVNEDVRRIKANERRDAAKQASNERVESQRTAREAMKNQRERMKIEARQQAMAAGAPQSIMEALSMQGQQVPGHLLGLDRDQAKAYTLDALKRSIMGIQSEQERNMALTLDQAINKNLGLGTKGLDKQLLNSGIKLDRQGLIGLNHLENAASLMPNVFGQFQPDIDRVKQMAGERLSMFDAYQRGKKEIGQLDVDMHDKDVVPGSPEYQAMLKRSLQLKQGFRSQGWITKSVGASEMFDDGAVVRQVAARRVKEDELRAAIMKRAEAQVNALKVGKQEETAVDFIAGKFKALITYLGAGAVIYNVVSALKSAASEAVKLESAMANIQGVLEGKSLSERLEIKKGVVDAASDMGVSITQAAQMAKTFAQTGIGAKGTVNMTRAGLAGVQGAGLDPQQTVELLIATQNLSKGLVQGSEIIDRISHVESQYAVTAQDLSVAIQRVGSIATQLQPQRLGAVDAFDTVIGATTKIVEQTRVTGSQAATSLRFMFARLASPDVAKSLQNDFGIRLATANGSKEMRPLSDIIGELANKYKELMSNKNPDGSAKQVQSIEAGRLLATFAGSRQINAAAALLNGWSDALKISTESALAFGDAQRRVAIQMDTWEGRMTQFQNALVDFMDQFLQRTGLLDMGKGVLKGLSKSLHEGAKDPAGSMLSTGALLTAALTLMAAPSWASRAGRALKLGDGQPKALLGGPAGTPMASGMLIGTYEAGEKIKNIPVIGTLAKNLGSLSKVFAFLSGWAFLITTFAGVGSWLMQKYNDKKVREQLERARYAPEPIDREQMQKSDRYTAFQTEAGFLNRTPGDLVQAVISANAQAQAYTSAQLGGNLFTTDDSKRTYNVQAAKTYEKEYLRVLTDKVPALREITDETERTNKALSLLRDAMVQVSGASGMLEAQFLAKMKTDAETTQSNFQKAREGRTAVLDASGLVAGQYSSTAGAPHYYTPDEIKNLSSPRSPGLGFTKFEYETFSKNVGRKPSAQEQHQLITQTMNAIAPGLGVSLGGLSVSGGAGSFTDMVSGLVDSGKTLGQAMDEVTGKFFELLVITKDMSAAERLAAESHNRTAQQNRETLVQREGARISGVFNFKSWEDAAKHLAGQGDQGVGGANAEKLIAWADSEARKRLIDALGKFRDPQSQALKASLAADLDARNRTAGYATMKQSGVGTLRDRILDALIKYGTQRMEDVASSEASRKGLMGFDAADARRSNARGLMQNINGAYAQTQGDLIRAYEALNARKLLSPELQAQRNALYGDMTQNEQGKWLINGQQLDVAGEEASLEAQGVDGPERLKRRLEAAQSAMMALKSNQTLFAGLPDEYKAELTDLVRGPGKEDPIKWFERVLMKWREIKKFAEDQLGIAEREYWLQQKKVKSVEVETEKQKELLRMAHELAQVHRESRADFQDIVGRPGSDLAFRLGNIEQHRREQRDENAQEYLGEKASNRMKESLGLITPEDRKYQDWLAAKQLERKDIVANETANIEKERLLLQRRNELARSAVSSADSMIGSMGQGLKDALAQGWDGFKGSIGEVAQRLIDPFVSTLQRRMADNFVDAIMGPYSQIGEKLRNVFMDGSVLEYNLILRAHEEGAINFRNIVFGGGTISGSSGTGAGTGAGLGGMVALAGMGGIGASGAAGAGSVGSSTAPGDGGTQASVTAMKAQQAAKSQSWKIARDQLEMYAAQMAGTLIGGGLNSKHGMFGVRMGVNKGGNFASEGATMGAMIGGMTPLGPVGALIGGVLGGALGGLFKKKGDNQKQPPEYSQLERIERNTREIVDGIENTVRTLYDIDSRLLNTPASFTLPAYRPLAFGGSNMASIEINVNGVTDPARVADMVTQKLTQQMSDFGSYSSPK